MNIDFAKLNTFLEWATFLENPEDHKIEQKAQISVQWHLSHPVQALTTQISHRLQYTVYCPYNWSGPEFNGKLYSMIF